MLVAAIIMHTLCVQKRFHRVLMVVSVTQMFMNGVKWPLYFGFFAMETVTQTTILL